MNRKELAAILDQFSALADVVKREADAKVARCYNEANCFKWLRVQEAAALVQQAVGSVQNKPR